MIGIKFLNPGATVRILELAKGFYRPKEIIDLKERIEAETRAAELNVSVTKVIDCRRVEKIVKMKLELDALYVDWAQGKLS